MFHESLPHACTRRLAPNSVTSEIILSLRRQVGLKAQKLGKEKPPRAATATHGRNLVRPHPTKGSRGSLRVRFSGFTEQVLKLVPLAPQAPVEKCPEVCASERNGACLARAYV